MRTLRIVACSFIATVSLSLSAHADDWPQWLGPQGASEWKESGVRMSLPEENLPVKWRVDCSYGYAGPVVASGKVYVFDYEVESGDVANFPSKPIELTGSERLHCIDASSGNVVWSKGTSVDYNVSYPGGPRATPAVEGDRVYTLGTMGDLTCRSTKSGEPLWHVNFAEEFGEKTPLWGHSSCPLVEGNLVICAVGGEGTGFVAFHKLTGEVAWRALSTDEPGYCAPSVIEVDGQRQIIAFHPLGVSALNPTSGEVLWEAAMRPNYAMSTAPPRRQGDKLFVSGYGNSMMLQLKSPSDVEILWRGRPRNSVYCSNPTPYFADGVIYGCDIESSNLVAVDPESADRLWETRDPVVAPDAGRRVRHGTAFIVRHTPSGKFFLFNEQGELIVAELTKENFKQLGNTKLLEPTNEAFDRPVVWTHPAFAERCVFARNDKEIVCVDLSVSE